MQHADAVGEPEYEVEVVLDEQDGDLTGQALDELREAGTLSR